MNRDFRFFWSGQAASSFGSATTALAVPLVAVESLGATASQVGLLVAAGSAPMLLFGTAIATWGDGLNRKRPFLIRADVVAAAGTLTLAVLLAAGQLTVALLMAGVFLLGTVRTFVETVYFVHLRGLVGNDQVVLARARLQAGEQVGDVTGRAVVGPLVSGIAVAAPFLVDAVTYLVNAACLRLLRTPELPARPASTDGESFLRRMVAGVAELRRHPFLRRLLPYVMIMPLAHGAVIALTAPFLLRELEVPVALYGLAFVLLGVAGALGALVSSRLAKRGVDAVLMARWGFGLAPVPFILLATAGGPMPLAIALAAAGIGLPSLFSAIANVGLSGHLTRAVPQELLGRTAMVLQVAHMLPMMLGAPAGGLLADRIGVRPALAAATAVAALIAVAVEIGRAHV